METPIDRTSIEPDWDVFASDAYLGRVEETGDDYMLVRKGMIFVHDLFIPISAIERIEDRAVYLNVTKTEADNRGWDQPPTSYEHHLDANSRMAHHQQPQMTQDREAR